MKAANYFFYYSYIGLVTLAGFWGAFIKPDFDFRLLFHLDIATLEDFERVNLLSQYRFLRAIELGFGIFSLMFVKDIFTRKKFNRLFLIIMSLGILARIFSVFAEGYPSALMFLFFGFEAVGVIVIFFYSRKLVRENVIR